jgi:hypothetical protein
MRLFHKEIGICNDIVYNYNRVLYRNAILSKEGANFFQLIEGEIYTIVVDLELCKVIVYFGDIITREFEWTI